VDLPFDNAVLDLIRHRGPDAAGLCRSRVAGHDVILGHRRLSIVDLSEAGAQPMRTPCGRFTLVFNGEIYNHQELRERLRDVSFRGHSDTETILHYIARFGIKSVSDFNGIFALAILDEIAKKVHLARDPFGVKPLYYSQRGNRVAFASEIKPLLALTKDTISSTNLAELLRLRYLPSPDTLFERIRKIRPGHFVTIELDRPEPSCDETPYIAPLPANSRLSYRDALERYRQLFEGAVNRQLMSDVEVAVLLSGGVDSALVAACAQERSPAGMKAFTIGFNEDDHADEIADAAETARLLGLDHHYERIGIGDFFEGLRHCTVIVEEPLATTSIIPMFHLSRLAAAHVKVALSGQGADEALGGYGRYQGELLYPLLPSSLLRLAARWAPKLGVRREKLLRGLKVLSVKDDVSRMLGAYSVFDPGEIKQLTGIDEAKSRERVQYVYDLLGCRNRRESVARAMSVDLRMNLSDDLLLYTDKITMHHSIECRVPILDLDLVRFVESLPAHFRVQLGKGKRIHKDYALGKLPKAVVTRKKKGFLSPTRKWFRMNDRIRQILLEPGSRFSSWFDHHAVERVLKEHNSGINRERHIFLLLATYYWMETFA
jgi:asparagine synthase (glutamine-hydrolysing)